MTDEEIFAILRSNVLEALPDTDAADIVPGADLQDLGANSLDRVDILAATLDTLGLDGQASKFAGITDLDHLTQSLLAAGGWA
jgi:polyketide biosynthesis acyl carrier protein